MLLVALTLAGTAWGQDDHFPFGPMKMYARNHPADAWISDTWPYARDESGRELRLTQARLGIRRAEIEGQLPLYARDPDRLGALVEAYEERNPGRPRLVRLEIRTRRIQMRRGEPTGVERTVVRARWRR